MTPNDCAEVIAEALGLDDDQRDRLHAHLSGNVTRRPTLHVSRKREEPLAMPPVFFANDAQADDAGDAAADGR